MDVAEMMVKAAENTEPVCEAVKNAKTAVSGAVVAVSDVSSIPHPVCVRLTSDSITDFSAVSVKRYGKNLFDKDNPNVKSWYIQGGKILQGTNGRLLYIPCRPNTTYTMSKTLGSAFFLAYTTEEPKVNISCYGTVTKAADNITITTGEDAFYLVSYFYNAVNDTITLDEMLSSIQIEVGTTATPYEQYKAPTTYTANADGTVDGIRSLSPSMTLVSDNDGVVINARYFPESARGMQIAYGNLVQAETKLRDDIKQM
jgi:hypothetical protein